MNPFTELKAWFKENKRILPWRNCPSPYAVWVSEIMLQQTQVAVVISYFDRWMKLFPSVEALAAAPLDAVIKAWEGLGYYSRARNLHAGAQYVMQVHNGQLPSDASSLNKIKGIGPYTAGAIRSFAFHQKAAAVDGNVIRVLTRYFNLHEDTAKPKTLKKIWELADSILPDKTPWELVEGLIELGATVCTKKPLCAACPLKSSCLAYINGEAELLPYKSSKIRHEKLFRIVPLISSKEGKILVKRVQQGNIMSGLHEFPYFETSEESLPLAEIITKIDRELGIKVDFQKTLPTVQHSFTRYQVRLFPSHFECSFPREISDYQWMFPEELEKFALSSGHRRIFKLLF